MYDARMRFQEDVSIPTSRYRLMACSAAVAVLCVPAAGRQPVSSPAPVSFDVPGRSDSTPWIAANGSFVAVTWGASAVGKTDVFLAVSRRVADVRELQLRSPLDIW